MKKVLLVLSVCAVLVVLLGSAALATQHGGTATAMATATATATATASPTATAVTAQYAQDATATATPLPPTGGPSPAAPVGLLAALALMGSGIAALVLVRHSAS
jgi:hypothetical protein